MNLNVRSRPTRRIGKILTYTTLMMAAILLLFPIVTMLCNSLMESKEVVKTYAFINGDAPIQGSIGFKLIPNEVSLIQYYNVLMRKPTFLMMFWNSVIITVPIVMGQIVVSVLGAYAFAKLRFPFREPLFFTYIIVMLMPFQVTLVPNFILLRQINLMGSFAAVILPGIFSTFGVFLLRQFMAQVPYEYCEAAKMDGAGHFFTFLNIILPQCKGAVASLAILVFIDNWNIVEQPLIFLDDIAKYPLSIYLSQINSSELGLAFACGVLFMLPSLLVFLYGEDYLVEGIQHSGLK